MLGMVHRLGLEGPDICVFCARRLLLVGTLGEEAGLDSQTLVMMCWVEAGWVPAMGGYRAAFSGICSVGLGGILPYTFSWMGRIAAAFSRLIPVWIK